MNSAFKKSLIRKFKMKMTRNDMLFLTIWCLLLFIVLLILLISYFFYKKYQKNKMRIKELEKFSLLKNLIGWILQWEFFLWKFLLKSQVQIYFRYKIIFNVISSNLYCASAVNALRLSSNWVPVNDDPPIWCFESDVTEKKENL